MMSRIIFSLIFLLTTNLSAQAQYNLAEGIWDVAWNRKGTLLAVANPDANIYIYDVSGQVLHTFSGHQQRATSVAWSPDGDILASAGYDSVIRFWDVEQGKLIHEMETSIRPISNIDWQPNSTYLAIAGADTVSVWDTETSMPVTTNAAASLINVAWKPDGSVFAYAALGGPGIVSIEEGAFNVIQFTTENDDLLGTYSISWNKEGSQLVSAGEGVVLWDVATMTLDRVLLQTDETFYDAQFIGPMDEYVVGITAEGSVYLLDVLTGKILQSTAENAFLWSLSWNAETALLALGGTNHEPVSASSHASEGAIETGFLSLHPLLIDTVGQ